jgi:hypothetical protein
VASQLDARAPETVGRLARGEQRLADLQAYWPRHGEGPDARATNA